MSTDKYAVSCALIIVCIRIAVSNVAAQWVIDDSGCITPGGGVGNCIPIKNCKPLVDYIQQSRPLTPDIIDYIRSFHCGYLGNTAKVCCPYEAIQPKEPTVPITEDIKEHKNLNLLSEDCGILNDQIRIIGGNKTGLFEFPWMALLSYNLGSGIDFRCGGTIINEWYILTAAHCISHLGSLRLIGIRLGEHDINSRVDCAQVARNVTICASPVQDIAIGETIPHPDYDPNVYTNDIGLVRLATPINITVESAKPICLPTTDELRNIDFLVHNFTVTGWGVTEKRQRSPELLKANVPVVSPENCLKAYEKTTAVIDKENHVCAGSKTSDSCSGDSGGPLQKIDAYNGDVRYIQYGIVSFGPKFCGNSNAPGVYTRVDRYMKWILDNLRP